MAARMWVASSLAVVAAAALVLSAFQPWYGGREPKGVPAADLFQGLESGASGSLGTSMLLPLAGAALIALIALVVRSRVALAVSGLVALATCVLWWIQQGKVASFAITDLESGFRNAAGAVLFLLVAVAVLPGREGGRRS
ncbi:hypothetical protein [Streptomyces sp. MST-110588]|uniref:hypothetical protein n=1 Tax=Streptomyces sp. MST-110588 TaxID=2833628 RepID=UPI001F5C9250|nr:hypothetical protein [Streptomyces sp. MST-110588]UNO41475.1 hypothetical protein KGS77_20275 [Streptomyces sp. MST-110588]